VTDTFEVLLSLTKDAERYLEEIYVYSARTTVAACRSKRGLKSLLARRLLHG